MELLQQVYMDVCIWLHYLTLHPLYVCRFSHKSHHVTLTDLELTIWIRLAGLNRYLSFLSLGIKGIGHHTQPHVYISI